MCTQFTQHTLQELFGGIDKCGHLTRLAIENNLFPCLPYELARITSLTSIGLEDNPLVSPPPEIRHKGTQDVMDYLKRFDEVSVFPLHSSLASC
jgi:hypothetical protein